MIRLHSRVRLGDHIGVVTCIVGKLARVAWNAGTESYVPLLALEPVPYAVTLPEALAFVERAKSTGARSVAVPMDVLDALVAGCTDSR